MQSMKGKGVMSHLKKGFVLLFIIVLILSISTSALAETGVFNTAAVNLRKSASKSSSSLGLVSKGATCDILGESGSWLYVLITSHTKNEKDLFGKTGWVMAKFVDRSGGPSSGSGEGSGNDKTYDDIPSNGSLTNGIIKLSSGYLKVRALPSQSSTQIGQLNNGDSVTYYNGKLTSIGSDSYTWYKLTSPYKGFVATNYVEAGGSSEEDTDPTVCNKCGKKMSASYSNITKGAYYKMYLDSNSNYVMIYHATATKIYSCSTHPENTYNAGTVQGYIREDNPNYFMLQSPV